MSNVSVSRGYLHEEYRLFHIRDQKDIQIDAHFHSFDKVIFFEEGNVTYTIEGKSYHLEPRDILLIRHDEVHRPVIGSDCVYDRWILYLDTNFLQACSTTEEPLYSCFDISAATRMHLLRPAPETQKRLSQLLRQMQDAENSDLFGHKLLSRALLVQILVSLCRSTREPGSPVGADYATDAQITQVVTYIQNHLDDDLSAESLARRFQMTPSFLLHRFRRVTGYTPHGYVQLKRLLNAAELISRGVPAGDASRQSGYHDYSVFSRAFTKRFGVSPSRYRPDIDLFHMMDE